ncbi:uroporphyrinogen-III synthase [Glaciecola sp. MH2013]|uniref:uroporphyrinogen-III synthase n=1 Tax=Glaciecola sp. MH2013 TaxID=2785524 RepID=UPI00189EB23D|nr:uroporphyrinogen-III synthase [Glaciecola sp. MH2013]MBF7073517.1 uroporphyrinogen-III synthase [Glaciecola sp. MH2013]
MSLRKFRDAGLLAEGCGLIDIEKIEGRLDAGISTFFNYSDLSQNSEMKALVLVTSTFAAAQIIALSNKVKRVMFANSDIIAVGPSTLSALQADMAKINQQNFSTGSCILAKPANSEGVITAIASLAHKPKRAMLVKGEGGRGLIEAALRASDIELYTANIYRRIGVKAPLFLDSASTAISAADFAQDQIQCIIATSVEIVDAAYLHFEAQWLNSCRWIVVSQRIELHLNALGAKLVTLSNSATDTQLIAAAKQVEGLENV